jgi:hypothetical protein
MKLSELVAYRNELRAYDVSKVTRQATTDLDKLMYTIQTKPVQLGTTVTDLEQCYQTIQDDFSSFYAIKDRLLTEVNNAIEVAEKHWFQTSYKIYEDDIWKNETAEYILARRLNITDETRVILKSRLKNYSNWQQPGMIIRPGAEDFIHDMVSFDPLYLIDRDYDLINPSLEGFSPLYQSRVRKYLIKERIDGSMLQPLPNGQFGLCFAYNFFNYTPIEFIRKYAEEIYQKLRPGGILIMTINDCDQAHAVALVENNFACYTPGGLVKDLVHNIGYEQVFTWTDHGDITWLEFRKPGEMHSLKGGQTLAKVVAKSK